MATLSQKDVKDVSQLVTKKLELYANREKRENGFDPFGAVRTTHKMYKYDFMYRVLDYDVWDRDSPRYPKKKKTNDREQDNKKDQSNHGTQKQPIDPKVLNNSRRMVLYKEVDRLALNATKVFENLPIDKLHVIHRYRPSYHGKIQDTTETGKVQNYTRHVGAVLKSQDYINYYIKEGLQTGDASKSKRLKEITAKKENKDEENEGKKEKDQNEDNEKKEERRKPQKSPRPFNPTIKVVVKKKEKTS